MWREKNAGMVAEYVPAGGNGTIAVKEQNRYGRSEEREALGGNVNVCDGTMVQSRSQQRK